MKTIEIKLYSFNELSEESKQVAIKNFRNKENDYDYIWSDAHKTVKAFHNIFPTSEGFNSWLEYRHDLDDNVSELTGLRLRKYILNNFGAYLYKPKFIGSLKTNEYIQHKRIKSPLEPNKYGNRFNPYYSAIFKNDSCVLTGVCYDDYLLKPIYDFLDSGYKNENINILDLFDECFNSLKRSINNEIEYRESDEGIEEEILSQDLEFTEDGKEF